MGQYGLLGETLGHSYSPEIHKEFGSWPYNIYQKAPSELESFLTCGSWDGLNVTIPYKKTVLSFCHELSPMAQNLGSVNTLIRRTDGSIYGDNTDAFGFLSMCQRMNLDFSEKKALVLGSGGASVTAQWVLRQLGASVVVISRQGVNHYGNLGCHTDAQILVNTTPVGMYPHNDGCPLSLELFPRLEGVLDLIYNPARTRLILQAQELEIPCCSGLYMLVAQAAKASALFTGTEPEQERVDAVYRKLQSRTQNLILIGMPGCGKSTIGSLLAKMLNRPFYDSDDEMTKQTGMTPEVYLHRFGESSFREQESQVLKRLGAMSGIVMATGGGCVTRPRNAPYLRQNGIVIWLQRELSRLSCQGRPLSQKEGVAALFARREESYKNFSDLVVCNGGQPEHTCKIIMEALFR